MTETRGPDLSPVQYEMLDEGGNVTQTGVVQRVAFEAMKNRGVRIREVPAPTN